MNPQSFQEDTRRFQAAAVVPLACFGMVLGQKLDRGEGYDILWACHVATLWLALGLGLNRRTWVEAATLFHLAAGLPGWLTDWIVGGHTTWSSAISHVLTPTTGLWALGGAHFSGRALRLAFGLQAILLPLSFWLTPPADNVNQAHRVWAPLRAHLPAHWSAAWVGSLLGTGLGLGLGWWLSSRWARRKNRSKINGL